MLNFYTSLQNVFFFSFSSLDSFLQESRKRVKLEKKEPLVESQLFIMELARELNKICQVSSPPPPFSFLAVTRNYKHSFIISVFTPEVKHPRPYLDQRGHLAAECVSWLYRRMGCRAGDQSAGTNRFHSRCCCVCHRSLYQLCASCSCFNVSSAATNHPVWLPVWEAGEEGLEGSPPLHPGGRGGVRHGAPQEDHHGLDTGD